LVIFISLLPTPTPFPLVTLSSLIVPLLLSCLFLLIPHMRKKHVILICLSLAYFASHDNLHCPADNTISLYVNHNTWVYTPHFLYSSINRHLGWLHNLVIVNSPTTNMDVQASLFDCFEYIPSSGVAGSYGSSIYSFLRSLHSDFHSDTLIYN
jgi:hypothetical protein